MSLKWSIEANFEKNRAEAQYIFKIQIVLPSFGKKIEVSNSFSY